MALCKCRECGKEVSSEAKTCPGCGIDTPAEPPKKTRKTSGLLKGLLAILVLGGIVSAAFGPKSSDSAAPSAATEKPTAEKSAADKKRDAQIELAVAGALQLKRAMKDPEAFDLNSLVVKKSGAACYQYRAKNSFGATFPGEAVLTAKGKILVHEKNGNSFVDAWNKECTAAGGDDITSTTKTALTLL